MRLFVFVLALLAAVPPLSAAQAGLGLDADDVQFRVVDGATVAEAKGNARFEGEGMLLTADAIRYEQRTESFYATGRVVLTRGTVRLLADRLTYRRTDGQFSAEGVRFGTPPYFAEAERAEGTPKELTLHRARVSYGEPGGWQPTFRAEKFTFAPNQRVETENASAGIGLTQPLPFPKFEHDFRRPIEAAVALNGGFRRSLGAFVEAGVMIPVSRTLRVGPDLGLYTARGVMIGPALSYSDPKDPEKLRGTFHSGYIRDHGDRSTDLLGRPIQPDRAWAEWQHHQQLAPNLTLNAQLHWWKDSEITRDFRPRAFFPVQEPDSFVEAIYGGANYFVTAFARVQPNRFHRVQERLPELRFDLLPLALPGGFVERFSASAAALREDPVGGVGRELRSDRLDAYYQLTRPVAATEWLAFTPVAGGRVTHYMGQRGATQPNPDNYTRVLGELGLDAALRASATFDYKNPVWKIDGLRHLVTPRFSYRYIPEADKGRARIPQIDRESFSTYLQPLGLGDRRNIDELHATNTLRLGLDNILQTRDPKSGPRDLVMLNVAADLRFRRPPGTRDLSEIHTELALTPARWLQVDVYQSFAARSLTLREFNSGITLRDGRVWSLRFSNNFLRHHLEDYAVHGRLRLNERFEALTKLHYDARKRRLNEQAYGLAHNLGNTWLISYTVSLYEGRRRENSFGFNVQVDTVRF
ncbi:MAG: LPS assembly protein LptD [Opitutaceae bacterium]|nr:LPS assembly protein LptD [Opitutaceae bacterium]